MPASVPNWSKANWFKSSRSFVESNCVEVAHGPLFVSVRDSRNPEPTLAFSYRAWAAFVAGAKMGEFDRQ